MSRFIAIVILTLVVLAGSTSAETIYLRGGGTLEGKVLELKEASLVMTLRDLEDSRLEVPFERVSDYSLYELKRARIDAGSAEDHERLGDWAQERGLLALAMDEYQAALDIHGSSAPEALKEKHVLVSYRCGADKLDRGQKLLEEGDLSGARAFFRDIVKNHPTCPAAETARRQVAELGERIEKQRAALREKRDHDRTALKLDEGLRSVKMLMEKGDRLRRLGLRDSGSLGRAEDDFLAAIEAFLRARSILDRAGGLPGARGRVDEFAALGASLERRLVDVYVDVGHNYVVKGNLIRANRYMGLALAIDPNDPKALALRSTIGIATADDRWGRPGR